MLGSVLSALLLLHTPASPAVRMPSQPPLLGAIRPVGAMSAADAFPTALMETPALQASSVRGSQAPEQQASQPGPGAPSTTPGKSSQGTGQSSSQPSQETPPSGPKPGNQSTGTLSSHSNQAGASSTSGTSGQGGGPKGSGTPPSSSSSGSGTGQGKPQTAPQTPRSTAPPGPGTAQGAGQPSPQALPSIAPPISGKAGQRTAPIPEAAPHARKTNRARPTLKTKAPSPSGESVPPPSESGAVPPAVGSTPARPPENIELVPLFNSDKGHPYSGTITFAADLTSQNLNSDASHTARIDRVLISAGEPSRLFPRRGNLPYKVEGGYFICTVPVGRDSSRDVSYSLVLTLDGSVEPPEYVLAAKGWIPKAERPLPPPPYWLWLCCLVILVAVLILAFFVIRGRRGVRGEQLRRSAEGAATQPWPQQPQFDPYAQEIATKRKIDVALQPIQRSIDDSVGRLTALEGQISGLRGDLSSVRDRVRDDWSRTIGNLADLQAIAEVVPPAPNRREEGARPAREEQAVLAIVNDWVGSGWKKRQEMLEMAGKLGLSMQLMEQKDPAKVLGDVMGIGMVDLAESPNDGGWLFCQGSDGIAYAAPADANLFQASPDRMLLQRMFSDLDTDSEPLRFTRVYRACRVRTKQPPYRYEIVQKGVLQLAGSPSPMAFPPADYESLLHPVQPRPVIRPSTPALIPVLKEQFEAVAERLGKIESGLNRILEGLNDPIASSRIADLNRSVERVLQSQIRQLEQRLEQRVSPAAPSPAPETGSDFVMGQVRRLRSDLTKVSEAVKELAERTRKLQTGAAATLVERPPEVEVSGELAPQPSPRVEPPSFAVTIPPPGPAPAPVEPAPELTARASETERRRDFSPRPVESPPSPVPPPAARRSQPPEPKPEGLPRGWPEVVSGLGAFRGLEEQELAESLKKLKDALAEVPGGAGIRLVHLKESLGRFQVHGAAAVPEGQVLCTVCGEAKTFQSAVCAGEEGAATLHVLLPPGDYAPYNYPAGYHRLIQNVPNQQFHIQTVASPAVLTIVAGSSPTEYEVQYKLQWG